MHPPLTYELRVTFAGDAATVVRTKERLTDWLLMNGVESFVEGVLDVDFNQNQDEPPRDFYTEMGGDLSPLSVYRYSRESLDDLKAKLELAFAGQVATELNTLQTEAWMEGWKESFRPFATEIFYVRPPWVQEPVPPGRIPLVIEPGMAFGTGQHATTRLCLEELGRVAQLDARSDRPDCQVLDVGTGTAILAIGARKLGYGAVRATDIEEDALLASRENARVNEVELELTLGTFPAGTGQGSGGTYRIVLANILAVVILRLMDDLAAATAPGGHLILSGILVEEEEEVARRAEAAGLERASARQGDGWSCLVMTRPQGPLPASGRT